jgi:hypothetical protein
VGSNQYAKEDRKLSRQLAQALGKIVALVLIVVAVVLAERYCQVAVSPFDPDAKISAIDGDSLRAEDGVEYRLFGIDAPELHQSCNDVNGKPWQCGRAAKAELTAIINRGDVTRLKRPSAASGEGLSSAPPTGAQRIPALETEESAVHAIGYRFVSSKGLVDGA